MASGEYVIEHPGHVLLGNSSIEVSIDTEHNAGLARITNKITGREYSCHDRQEVSLRFRTDAYCAWIRGWRLRQGSGEAVDPGCEAGFLHGFHQPGLDDSSWASVAMINDFTPSPAGYSAVIYPGYAWYRAWFDLPADAAGTPVEIVVGGTDNQDWLHYRFYVNGVSIGAESPSGDWHHAPTVVIDPTDPSYESLRFGGDNLLAVQTRGLDRSTRDMLISDCERYSVGTWNYDQRVSAGPLESEVSDFRLVDFSVIPASRAEGAAGSGRAEVVLSLVNQAEQVAARARYWIDGDEPSLHKQVTITNNAAVERTLLEMDSAAFGVDAGVSSGGYGLPCYIGGDVFCGVRHPAGIARGHDGVRLTTCPGRRLAPGASYEGKAVVFGVGSADGAGRAFVEYIERHGHRKRELLSMMHCYGMHDLASMANPVSLTEDMVLKTLDLLADYKQLGIGFDWYWIDAGWYNPVGDLTDFDPAYFPDGPSRVLDRIKALGMRVGLWTSPVCGPMAFHEGKGITNPHISEPGAMCLAEGAWRGIYRDALLHHVRVNGVEGFKFDGVNSVCNHPGHEHLPGKYSVEPIVDALIDTMEEVRRECPEVFHMLYWSIRSPWWLLWGDTIYERGILMEGATPCDAPSALMRQSITVSLDQATDHAWDAVPLISGDSLGVWISEWRWGSYLKTEWWQAGWIMDIARGSLLSQLWGDITMFTRDDAGFLAHISAWMRENSHLLLDGPSEVFGDPWNGGPYGYAYLRGGVGVVFVYNPAFEHQDVAVSLGPPPNSRRSVTTIYPRGDGRRYLVTGDTLHLRLRPFEVRMVQVHPAQGSDLPEFVSAADDDATIHLDPEFTQVSRRALSWDDCEARPLIRGVLNGRVGMADQGDSFDPDVLHDERDEHIDRTVLSGGVVLPPTERDTSLLIIARLSRDGIYWHHRGLYNIIKAAVSIEGRDVEVSSLPNRWHEQAGMWSWILFRVPVASASRLRAAKLMIETCLPRDVDCYLSVLLFTDRSNEATGGE